MHTMSKNRRSIKHSQEYPMYFWLTQRLDQPANNGQEFPFLNLAQRTKRGYALAIKWCYFDQLER